MHTLSYVYVCMYYMFPILCVAGSLFICRNTDIITTSETYTRSHGWKYHFDVDSNQFERSHLKTENQVNFYSAHNYSTYHSARIEWTIIRNNSLTE